MGRNISEEQKEKARIRTREYIERTGRAAQKAYQERVLSVNVSFHPEKDADIIAFFEADGRPRATIIKEVLREAAGGSHK